MFVVQTSAMHFVLFMSHGHDDNKECDSIHVPKTDTNKCHMQTRQDNLNTHDKKICECDNPKGKEHRMVIFQ